MACTDGRLMAENKVRIRRVMGGRLTYMEIRENDCPCRVFDRCSFLCVHECT